MTISGGELIDLLKEARDGLGKVDIRFLGNPSLDKKIGTFLAEATFLEGEFNNNKLKNSLKMKICNQNISNEKNNDQCSFKSVFWFII